MLIFYAQSWTALFRAFSSHRQPSAIFSKVFPAEQTSWPNWQTLLACTEVDMASQESTMKDVKIVQLIFYLKSDRNESNKHCTIDSIK